MDIQGVVNWILRNPNRYPGQHLTAAPRTLPKYKPLEPTSQLLLVWRATIEYLQENLLQGKGVNIRGFGAFTFDVSTELPRTANINPAAGDINEQREERKHLHRNRPVFVPDPQLQNYLRRYHGKEQLEKPRSQHSVYQKGFSMVFCNPVPIAAACFLDKTVVADSHNAIWSAVRDLVNQGRSLNLQFNFAVLVFESHALRVTFSKNLIDSVNRKDYQYRMRRSDDACASFWRTTNEQRWRSSALSSLWQKPESRGVQTMNEKTLALKIMSLDMASTVKRPVTTPQGAI